MRVFVGAKYFADFDIGRENNVETTARDGYNISQT